MEKSKVVSFCQDVKWKKWSYVVFSGVIPEKVEKNGVIAFFLVLV